MLLATIFNNFTCSPQLYRHSGTDIPSQVPDIDNQPGDEDLYVPGSASHMLTNSVQRGTSNGATSSRNGTLNQDLTST